MLKFHRFHRQKWGRAVASFAFFSLFCCPVAAQSSQPLTTKRSATAQRLARQGYQQVQQCDPTIHVSLMYARPDNFCGVVLYSDLREAFLHPQAMKALQKAQSYLKQLRPDLSLKVYDAARPMHIQHVGRSEAYFESRLCVQSCAWWRHAQLWNGCRHHPLYAKRRHARYGNED